jgi:hypothetical protein
MELGDKIKEICKLAQYRISRTGCSVHCQMNHGIDTPPFMDFIETPEGEICIATIVHSEDNIGYSTEVDLEKMKTCPYLPKKYLK